MSDAQFTPVEAIFAGWRLYSKSKVILFYINQTERAVFDSPRTRKLFKHAVVGGVYLLERNGDSFRFSNKLLRHSEDPRTAQWHAEQTAADVAERADKLLAAERAKGKDALRALLAPMRREYHSTNHIGRLALEVVLLDALRHS